MHDVIIVPTYNEKENIQKLIPKIYTAVSTVTVVVVDDISPDGTAQAVSELTKNYPSLYVIQKPKEGLGAAYKHVLTLIAQDPSIRSIVTMDADGSHDPVVLSTMFKALDSYDVVIGSRYIRDAKIHKWPWYRKLLSRLGNIYAYYITRIPIQDLTSGFVAFNKKVLNTIEIQSINASGYAYQMEFKEKCYKAGFTMTEIPIIFKEREVGYSKITSSIIFEGILTPIKIKLRTYFAKK